MSRSGALKLTLAAALILAVSSCGRDQPGPAAPAISLDEEVAPDLFNLPALLMVCRPMPADTSTAEIGAAGGVINVGPHTLLVPAGALSEPVTITAIAPRAWTNQVKFAPEGLTFTVPAQLTMSYANCWGAGSLLPKRIAYTTNALQILEILLSVDNLLAKTVSADLDHFSKYAVAW